MTQPFSPLPPGAALERGQELHYRPAGPGATRAAGRQRPRGSAGREAARSCPRDGAERPASGLGTEPGVPGWSRGCGGASVACLPLGAASGLEVSMPEVVEAESESTARIECSFSIPGNGSYSYIDWFYVDRSSRVKLLRVAGGEVLEEETSYKGRLAVGEDKALSISKVTLQDARTFVCQVGAGSQGVGENHTELHVYKVPETPEIEASSAGIPVHSSTTPQIAQCVSENSFPPANITWYKNGEQLQPEENKVKILATLTRKSSGLYTVSSSLFAVVTREDRSSLFHCAVHYWLRGQRRSKDSRRVNITVFYPTQHVELHIVPAPALVKEGDDVKLVCEADGNPAPVFSFYKKVPEEWQDVTSLADTSSGVLSLHGVNKSSSGLYRCQILDLDDMTQMEKDVELVVNYIEGVRVQMEPSSPLHEGDSVRLSCSAHSPVDLDFQWRDERGRKVAEGNQLLLRNLTFETSSNFSCRVVARSVPGLEQSKQVAVAVQGKPRIVAISSPLYVRQDEVVNLTCKAIAFPRPSVRWSINGTAHEYVENQHVASNLTVRVSHDLLRAGAMCRVSNALGVSEKHIQLLDEKTSESKGVIIVAIIVCILVVAVLGSVIYFLHKKGKIPCGRAGKQDITKPEARKDKNVVEVKSDKLAEEAGLLQGTNGERRPAADQSEKYIDLRN
ncbi:cell surface glycoprotein MUC18 [Oxyura jamaicensis]|uniref:cell surface glycoprotein MUC18 n=1 Tax=Oxyura jamaicensis TaxID=8884 RepID=UPI0015A663C0|nr:cell surface glycoprotein MUC18 [Oxyura jamaicensis]